MSRLDELKARMNQTNNTSTRINTPTRLEQLKKQISTTPQPLPATAPYSSNGKLDPFALTQGVQNIAQTAREEEKARKINEITGGQPTAFMPRKLNVSELETAEQEFKENQRKQELAKDFLPQAGRNLSASVASGLANVHDATNAIINKFTSQNKLFTAATQDLLDPSKNRYSEALKAVQQDEKADRERMQWARDYNKYIQEGNQNYDGLAKGTLNAINVGGNMLASSPAGVPGLFLNSMGGAYNQALDEGATEQEAYRYGLASGALETAVETLSGGAAQKLTNVPALAKISKLTDNIDNKFLRFGANLLADVGGEGTEEMITALADPYIQKITYNPDAGFQSVSEALSSMGGAFKESVLPTLLMGGTSTTINGVQSLVNRQISAINSSNLSQNEKRALINQVKTEAQQIIQNVEKNDTPQSSQIEQTQSTNEIIPPVQQNQNTADMVQNNASVQNVAQNEANIEQNQTKQQEYSVKKTKDGTTYVLNQEKKFINPDGTKMTPKQMYNSLVGKEIDIENGEKVYILKGLPKKNLFQELFKRYPRFFDSISNMKQLNQMTNENIIELIQNSNLKKVESDIDNRHEEQGIEGFDTREVLFFDGENAYNVELSIANLKDGRKVAYAKKYFGLNEEMTKKIKEEETLGKQSQEIQQPLFTNSIASNNDFVNLPSAEELNKPSQEMIEAAQAMTLEEKENVTEKSQELFDELFANENLPQTYKFEMGERIEKATTINELDKIRKEISNYKSDLSKETIDERVVRVNEFLEAQKTKGEKTTKKEIRNKITDLLEIPNKGGNVKALSQIAGEINELLVEGKLTDTKINEIVESLPERVRTINEEYLNEYGELKNELKKRAIYVSENVRKGFASWNDFKKSNLNKLKLTKDTQNITVEQLYQELSSQYEDLFPSDISNPADQLQQISDVVSSIKRDVGDVDTALIGKYGQEGWNEIQDMLKDELKTIRDNLARTSEPIEYYEGGIKNRSYTKTAKKNDLVNEFLDVKDIQYQVQSNPSTIRMANETINNLGYEEAYNLIKNTINSGKRVTATDIALGERLIQESIKKGDFERATELITDVTIIGTELGQAVQAMRLINKMSPEGQLMYLKKVVNRMNAQNAQKNVKRDNKKLNELETKVEKGEQIKIGDNEIKIPEESQQELLKAQTQEEIDLAIEKIKEQLAAQLPVETFEKLDEWRYLSMLGRPKSHLRNVLSNIAMRGTYELKNEIQRGVEALAKNSLDERTRTFKKSTEAVKNFAKQSAEDNLNAIKGNGKLTVDKDIKARRKIFKNEVLERARKFNSNALDMEDTVFSKSAYVSNLAEYLTANGIKTQQDIDLNPDIVEKGIQFAIKESQKTTFRQYSALANAMNQFENINGISKVVIGGTLPFKKTPINIAKTGASYSPAGLIETLTIETKKLRDGQITGNEYIDRLSQGLTGTLITGLGYLLADIGVLSGAGEEDDEYAEAIGERAPYSIKIGNGHYNLSWLSPTAMPMFIGAEIQKAVQNEEDVDLNNIVDFLATTLDPLSEMSMVSSINDAFRNFGSAETSTGEISSFAGNAVGSYAGQYLPSIFSDINKIIDPTVRSTQASKNSKFKSGERLLRQSINKIPGGSYLLEPATDIWGNEKKRSDSIFARAADALISPGTYTEKKTTDVDRELLMLYDENSNKDIIPKVPKNYFSSNGYKYEMSAKEYTNYKKEYGQTAYKELQKLFSSKEYKEMDSEDKQKAIKDVYEKAQEKARFEYGLNPASLLAKYNEEEASKRLLGAKRSEKQQDSGIALIDFYEAWQAQKDVEGKKNFKGETISGTTKTNKIKAMKEAVPDLSMWELNKLYDVLN